MLSRYATFLLILLSTPLLVSCDSHKKEEVSETQPDELNSSEKQNLSLIEQEKLKINEDNVMNPFPG